MITPAVGLIGMGSENKNAIKNCFSNGNKFGKHIVIDNPFIKNGFLSPDVSINKLLIEKMPTNKVKEDLQGKYAGDIFSTKAFIDEIIKKHNELKLDINKIQQGLLPQYLQTCLESNDILVREEANNIAEKFGERLGVILLTLKKGESENRDKRPEWSDEHWKYWSKIKNVILVGGLASDKLGEILASSVYKVFNEADTEPYNIILVKNSSEAGIIGCSKYIDNVNNNQINLIFDFGQSFIKRRLVKVNNGTISKIIKLDNLKSENVKWKFNEESEERSEAKKLDEYLINSIISTLEICKDKKYDIGEEIIISIANYIENGCFANRGGYGKLRLISKNYEKYLEEVLYKKLDRKYVVKMIHDGTAMATAFSEYPKSVCISLGTAIGVGFPVIL